MGGLLCCYVDGNAPKRDELMYCQGDIRKFYEFESTIGQGSYGSVHRGRKLRGAVSSTDRAQYRAIKVLANDDENMDVLCHEVDILAQLEHPSVCRLYETFRDKTHTYLVMEICEGGELFTAIATAGRLTEVQSANVSRQMFQAIRYLHQKFIAHRDIKGENFLIHDGSSTDDAIIKLVDFGTARYCDPNCGSMTTALGTPVYMAPEVLKRKYGMGCDVWSCGIMLFIMLSGYPPFQGKNINETMKLVRTGQLVFRADYWDTVTVEAVDLVRKLLQRDTGKRYTPQQALEHSWLRLTRRRGGGGSDPVLNYKRLRSRLSTFAGHTMFQKVVLELVVRQVAETDIGELRDVFMSIDTDNSGFVTREELQEVLAKAQLENVDEILQQLDADRDGKVDYREFLIATLDMNYWRQERVLLEAFRMIDHLQQGFVTAADLTRVITSANLRNSGSEEQVEKIMLDVGKSLNDNITFEEFTSFVTLKVSSENVAKLNRKPSNWLDWTGGTSPATESTSAAISFEEPKVASTDSDGGASAAAEACLRAPLRMERSSISSKKVEWVQGPGNKWTARKSIRQTRASTEAEIVSPVPGESTG